mmetsp:Transcript_746/g.1782  ORF Transcript_746/g.1782 Transcript_746/m.1782 type:complete len:288 (+) Transcript_746:269-1132(+)
MHVVGCLRHDADASGEAVWRHIRRPSELFIRGKAAYNSAAQDGGLPDPIGILAASDAVEPSGILDIQLLNLLSQNKSRPERKAVDTKGSQLHLEITHKTITGCLPHTVRSGEQVAHPSKGGCSAEQRAPARCSRAFNQHRCRIVRGHIVRAKAHLMHVVPDREGKFEELGPCRKLLVQGRVRGLEGIVHQNVQFPPGLLRNVLECTRNLCVILVVAWNGHTSPAGTGDESGRAFQSFSRPARDVDGGAALAETHRDAPPNALAGAGHHSLATPQISFSSKVVPRSSD